MLPVSARSHLVRPGDGFGNLADPEGVLLPEREAEPSLDERVVALGDDRVVARLLLLVHPARRRGGVEVAHVLRLLDGVAGRLHPDVLNPDLVRPRLRPSR